MSLLNAWVTPTEATVAVDTDGGAMDGSRMPASKLLVIPHLNVAMALRGQLAFLALLFMRTLTASFDTFDQLNAAMLDFLPEIEGHMPQALIATAGGVAMGNELVIVGWSDARSKMLGRLFYKRDDMPDWVSADIDFHMSPYHRSMQDLPREVGKVKQIAGVQVDWMRSTFPNAACGGKLLVAHMTQHSVSITHQARFEEQELAA